MHFFRLLIVMGLLCVPQFAQEKQPDMEAMMYWSSADVVRYHIVGVYQAQTNVIGGSNEIGYADVTDRVVIDLKWKLSESKLVGTPVIQNEKSAVANLRNYEPKCLPPVLKGEYEHYELLALKDGLGGALEAAGADHLPRGRRWRSSAPARTSPCRPASRSVPRSWSCRRR